jgi:hypothetical protein
MERMEAEVFTLRVETRAFNERTGCWEAIDVTDAAECGVAGPADLEQIGGLSAADLGCAPGSEFRLDLVDADDRRIASVEVVAD